MKTITLSSVVYEMLVELAKKNRTNPKDFVETTIKTLYQGGNK